MSFIQNASRNPAITATMKEVGLLHKQIKRLSRQRLDHAGTALPTISPDALLKMLEILPQRAVCDRQVVAYFSNFEKSIRILHLPTFMKDYELFWSSKSPATFTDFLPQLTLVLVISSTLIRLDKTTREAESPVSATLGCALVQIWLDGLGGKERTQMSTLRTQCLNLLAQQLTSTQIIKTWNNTGQLVRSAMAMGLHRDPSESSNISVFQGEQRRKLWMTILEMDIQMSLTSSMPVMLRESDYSCQLPANVDDADLFESMTERPVGKPLDEWTDALSQIILSSSLPCRFGALQIAHDLKAEKDYALIVQQGEILDDFLRNLPAVLRINLHSSSSYQDAGRTLDCISVDVYIRRTLLCLYRPYVLQASTNDEFIEARGSSLRSSLVILSYQDIFDPSVADLSLDDAKSYWDLFHQMFKTDFMLAALTLCLEIKVRGNPPPEPSNEGVISQSLSSNPQWVGEDSSQTRATLIRAVDSALDCSVRRIGEADSNLKEPLVLSMIVRSLRTSGTEEQKTAMIAKGAKSVMEDCRHRFVEANGVATQNPFHPKMTSFLSGAMPDLFDQLLRDQLGSLDGSIDQSRQDSMNIGDLDFSSFDWILDEAWL